MNNRPCIQNNNMKPIKARPLCPSLLIQLTCHAQPCTFSYTSSMLAKAKYCSGYYGKMRWGIYFQAITSSDEAGNKMTKTTSGGGIKTMIALNCIDVA
jgi:hypothetical protein